MRLPLLLVISCAVTLGGCGPKKVHLEGLGLADAGQVIEACEVLAEGQLRFPNYAEFASAVATTCAGAVAELSTQADAWIASGELGAARQTADRALRLRGQDPATQGIVSRVAGAHRAGVSEAWDRGDEDRALQIAAALWAWRSGDAETRAWAAQLWGRIGDFSVAQARSGQFAEARARLDRVSAAMAGAADALVTARFEVDRAEANEFGQRARAAEGRGELSSAWMLARAAATLDPSREALVQRLWGLWVEAHALTLAVSTRDRHPRTAQIAQAMKASLLGGLVRPADAGAPGLSVVLGRQAPQCAVQVTTRPAEHHYVAGTREVANPQHVAIKAELDAAVARRQQARDAAAHAASGLQSAQDQVASFEQLTQRATEVLAQGEEALAQRRAARAEAAKGVADVEALIARLRADAERASTQEEAVAAAAKAVELAVAERERVATGLRELLGERSPESVATACASHPKEEHWLGVIEEARGRGEAVRLSHATATEELAAAQATLAELRAQAEERGLAMDELPEAIREQARAAREQKKRAEAVLSTSEEARAGAEAAWTEAQTGLERALMCVRFEEARSALERSTEQVRLARASNEALKAGAGTVDEATVRSAQRALVEATAALQEAEAKLAVAEAKVPELRAAQADARSGLEGARGLERRLVGARDEAARSFDQADADARSAKARLDATSPVVVEQLMARHPYAIETHVRTCTGVLEGMVDVRGRQTRFKVSAQASTQDDTWRGHRPVALIGDALLFPKTDEQLADEIDALTSVDAQRDVRAAIDAAVAAVTSVGPGATPEQEARAALLSWQLGAVGEPQVSATAARLFGRGW